MDSLAQVLAATLHRCGIKPAKRSGSLNGTICDAIATHGVPVPVDAIYGVNTRTASQLQEIRDEMGIRERMRIAGNARRMREDAMAYEWKSTHGEH